jgi:hypothetical protein
LKYVGDKEKDMKIITLNIEFSFSRKELVDWVLRYKSIKGVMPVTMMDLSKFIPVYVARRNNVGFYSKSCTRKAEGVVNRLQGEYYVEK